MRDLNGMQVTENNESTAGSLIQFKENVSEAPGTFAYINEPLVIREELYADAIATNLIAGRVHQREDISINETAQTITLNALSVNTGQTVFTDNQSLVSKLYVDAKIDYSKTTKYSFNYNLDVKPFYNDDNISLGWDAPANDIEVYMLTEPANNGDLRSSCFLHGTIQDVQVPITQANYPYDLFPSGITSGEVAEFWISSYSDVSYPMYHLIVHNTGININCVVEKVV
jgi:hypothetical protein